jgi:hypothetical protein
MKRLRTLKSFQIFKSEIKNQKPIVVDALFKAYPTMVPLSCRCHVMPDGTFKGEYIAGSKNSSFQPQLKGGTAGKMNRW